MTTVAKKSAADTVKQKKSGVLGRLWRAHKLDPQEQSVGHGDEEEQHGVCPTATTRVRRSMAPRRRQRSAQSCIQPRRYQ